MENRMFSASTRAEKGKGPVGRLRKIGLIPAVIYGGSSEPKAISLNEKEYVKEHHGLTESTIVTIKLEGKDHTVVVKDAQADILSGKILHVDFYEVEKGRNLRARVSLRIVGIPEGVRMGGVLENPTHYIDVECDPTVLPERVDVDVTKLQPNQSIHVKDLSIDSKVKVLSSPETVIAVVKYMKEEKVEAAPEAAAAAAVPGAEGAAPGTEAAAPGTAGAPGSAPKTDAKADSKGKPDSKGKA
jgi:large subunit ribosomal protein L25